jgi:hypothetical protein
MFKITFIVGFIYALSSCTKEVQIDIPGYEEQLVVDGFIETDRPPFVLLSNSKDIYAPTDLNSYLKGFISGALVTVSDGTTTIQLTELCSDNLPPGTEGMAASFFGIPEKNLKNYHLCAYTSFNTTIWGKVGKTYTLKILYAGKEYNAETYIPQPTTLDRVFWKPEKSSQEWGYSWATLSDPANQYDAYRWEVKRINLNAEGKPRDADFLKTYSPYFDDQFINGLTFDFAYENPMSYQDGENPEAYRGYYKLGDTVVIKFSKMDKSTFSFLNKKYTQLQTGGNPFASPINLPSNISGGALGFWSGFSSSYDTLICQP